MLTMIPPRSALFLPASNPRAIEKARTLDADLTILDLEDAVSPAAKNGARAAALSAVARFGERPVAIRINGAGSEWHEADVGAVAASGAACVVVPKVEDAGALVALGAQLGKPLVAMIESPLGVFEARRIAACAGVIGLFIGTNDLTAALRVPDRAGLTTALQMVVLAARAAGCWVLDGVYNQLDDPHGFSAECASGRALGFDGKTLIHPNQLPPCHAAFSPSAAELEDARALIAAAGEGASRFRDRMVEAMHVASAQALLARAG